MRELGILSLIDNGCAIYTKDSPEIIDIWKKGQAQKYRQVLGRSPGKREYAIRYVCRLLNMVGCSWSSKQVRHQSTLVRNYQLDRALLDDQDRLIVLSCIERKYQKYLKSEMESLDWSAILERLNQPKQEESEKSAETITEQELEGVTDDLKNVYTLKSLSVTENNPEESTLFEPKINPLDSERCTNDLAQMLPRISHKDILRGYNPCLVKSKQNKGFNSV